MNGFNSKVVCKNVSVTICEILFNITILIIHHKYRGRFATTVGGGGVVTTTYHCENPPPRSFTMGKPLWYAPGGGRTKMGDLMKTLHRQDLHLYNSYI